MSPSRACSLSSGPSSSFVLQSFARPAAIPRLSAATNVIDHPPLDRHRRDRSCRRLQSSCIFLQQNRHLSARNYKTSSLPSETFAINTPRHLSTTAATSAAALMSNKLIPSNPAEVMVIRYVTPNITTFSVPFARHGTAKIGGRGTLGQCYTTASLAC